jgi:hypothetical protein
MIRVGSVRAGRRREALVVAQLPRAVRGAPAVEQAERGRADLRVGRVRRMRAAVLARRGGGGRGCHGGHGKAERR